MGIIAIGVRKRVSYKRETTWGVLAGATGATQLRRVTSTFNLVKEAYQSNEIRTDYQVADMRHGVRSVNGSLNGELSPKTYSDFMAAVVARDFTAGVTSGSASITIAAVGSGYTLTRAAGSFLTENFRVGTVVRLTGAGLNAANAGNNLLVTAVSALVLTVVGLSATPLVPEGPIATVTVTTAGKVTYVPTSGHTDVSYTVEEFYSDIAQNEVYSGLKVGSVAVSLPATGFATTDVSFVGKDLAQTGTSAYFTTPTATGTEGLFAAVNGALIVNGLPVALLTSLDFTINRTLENAMVVGSNSLADVFTGTIAVTGNFAAYFKDGTFRDYFNAEAEVSIVMALTTSTDKTADFVAFTLPRIKVGTSDKNDQATGLSTTHSFTALLNSVTTGGLEATTIQITDSLA